MADLTDFPIGTQFWYLHRHVCVMGHYDREGSLKSFVAHYADENGVIHSIEFHAQTFDYLKDEIAAQRAQVKPGWRESE